MSLLISPFGLLAFALYIEVLQYWEVYIFIIVISSLIHLLIIMQCPSLSLVTVFILKSILSDMSIAIQLSFDFKLHGITFSIPLLSVSIVPRSKVIFYRQYMYEFCFCIHSASLSFRWRV